MSIIGRVTEFLSTSANALTRRVYSTYSRLRSAFSSPSHDWGRPDYQYWRQAYYCRIRGLELAGLFIKPLVNKVAAWTLGRPPHWKLESEPSEEALAQWWDDNHSDILAAWRDGLKTGDSFAVINPDLSLTLVNADIVEPMVSDDDYSDIVGWRITQTYPHPSNNFDKQVVTDEYTAEGRTRIVEQNGVELRREEWPNLIGRLPLVHIPNQPQSGETFGHPEAEALVNALQRYNATIEAALDGNQLQGRPTPVLKFETVEGYNQFWADYGTTESQTLPDGTTQTVESLSVDLSQLMTVVGAEFAYESPGSFAEDTVRLLEILFYLVLEHTELPEFVFGNAISSSKASAETQMPVFIRFIEMRRGEMAKWLQELAEIALAYLALVTPGVSANEAPVLQWEALDQDDGQLTLDTVRWAYAEGLLDARTALMLAPVDIDDIDSVLAQAEQEREEAMPESLDPSEETLNRLFRQEIEAQEN